MRATDPDSGSSRETAILIALLLAGLLVRVLLVLEAARDETLAAIVRDDAFYYLTIARHVLEGRGSTFDGLAPTNGYHPLWMLLVLPVMALRQSDSVTVALVMVLGALLWTAGGLFLADLSRSLFSRGVARIASIALYTFHPFAILLSLNGLETSLVVALHVALFAWHARRSRRSDGRWSTRSALRFGCLCGLVFLARTDSATLLLLVSLGILAGDRSATLQRRLAWLGSAAGVASVLVAPWIAWNLLTFGTIVQTSGTSLTFVRQTWARDVQGLPGLGMLSESWLYLSYVPWALAAYMGVAVERRDVAALMLMALLSAAWLAGRGRLRPLDRVWIPCVTGATVALLILHSLVRWTMRDWYYAIPALLVFLAVAMLVERVRGRWAVALAVVVALVWPLAAARPVWELDTYPGQVRWWASAGRASGEKGRVKAAPDCGITAFRQPGNRIVNLDGLVNNEIVDYYREGRGVDYLFERQVDVAALRLPYAHPRFMGPAGLQLVTFDTRPYGLPKGQIYYRLDRDPARMYERSFPREPVELGRVRNNVYLGVGWRWLTEDVPVRWSIDIEGGPVLHLPLLGGRSYVVTLRLRKHPALATDEATVFFNEVEVDTLGLTIDGRDVSVSLPPELVSDGVNTLRLAPGSGPAAGRGRWRWMSLEPQLELGLETMVVAEGGPRTTEPRLASQ